MDEEIRKQVEREEAYEQHISNLADKEFNLSEKRQELICILCMRFNVTQKQENIFDEILELIEEQDNEFIERILKEHCEWRKELDYDKLVTESFESRVKRIAGRKLS